MKRGIIVIMVLIAGLQYKLWCEQDGLLGTMKLNQAIESQEAVNAKIKQINAGYRAEVEDLKRGTAAIEEHARTELGLVKKNEIFIQFI